MQHSRAGPSGPSTGAAAKVGSAQQPLVVTVVRHYIRDCESVIEQK